jgi:hypothetical protein
MAAAKQPHTVRMYRSADAAQGGPTEADVHPDEVENYRAAGFSTDKPVQARGDIKEKE